MKIIEKTTTKSTNFYSNFLSLKRLINLTLVLITGLVYGQTTVTLTTPGAGTWTVPCGVTSITVQVWGGGGGGYGDNNNDDIVGYGGGGGGFTTAIIPVSPGQIFNYNVGSGGIGGSPNGGTGGNSFFSTLTANGGAGGTGGIAGQGGTASGGTMNTSGNNGNAGSNPTGGAGGNGGGPGGGAGGTGGGDGVNGFSGLTPGGGGGASGDRSGGAETGGAGARGEIRITYTVAFSLATYCSPTFTSGSAAITNVTFGGINNTTSASNLGVDPFVQSFCDEATVLAGSPTNPISLKGRTYGTNTFHFRAFFDWNQNGNFTDTGESYYIGTINNSSGADLITAIGNIAVPSTALGGRTRMRIMYQFNSDPTNPCRTGTGNGQAEDYIVNVLPLSACSSPTLQPTNLNLTASGTSINGSFTVPIPAPNNYLVVMNTTGTVPNPTNGTSYTIGSTIGAGNTVIDNDGNATFTATGLTVNTTYYFFIFSFNSICTGGPLYYTSNPLNGSTTTLGFNYCNPSTISTPDNRLFINDVGFVGTLNDVTNFSSSFSTTTPGYQNFTTLTNRPVQAQGSGVNIYVGANTRGRFKAWIDWNKNGTFENSELVYDTNGIATVSTTFGFIIPDTTPIGDYRIRIRFFNSFRTQGPNQFEYYGYNFDACEIFNTVSNGSNTFNAFGEAEDYLFTVVPSCSNIITSITNGETCGIGPVNLTVTGIGTQFKWYANETGGLPLATTSTGNWTTPILSNTTTYYVTTVNGCESLVRTKIIAKISPIPTVSFTPNNPIVCGDNTILALTAGGDTEESFLINEDFESGDLGVFSNINYVSNPAVNNKTAWQNRTSTFVPSELVWYPAISSGFGPNKFAMSTSDVGPYSTHNGLISPIVNSNEFLNLSLTFKLFYSRYFPDETNLDLDFVTVDISTNGGTTWTTQIVRFNSDVGFGTRFSELSFDLSAFINQPNLRLRIRYYADWGDGVAVDDIKLFGNKPLNTSFEFASSNADGFIDAEALIPYDPLIHTDINTIYLKPNISQLELETFDITATAVLSNGCNASELISVVNNSRVFSGVDGNWDNPTNWKPNGIPTIDNCVVIDNNSSILGVNYQAYAKDISIRPTGNLNILTGNSLTVKEMVNVNSGGVFELQNASSLIQIDNVNNTGDIIMRRNTNVRKTDYVYWSSPVANFAAGSVSPATSTNLIWKWNPTIDGIHYGTWESANEIMALGKGYIIRGPNNYTASPQLFTATFTGVPHNGDINAPISRGTYTAPGTYNLGVGNTSNAVADDDNWNLIGNPYPSAIDAKSFLDLNTNIEGGVRLWSHGTEINPAFNNPFYGNFGANYTTNDYITFNALESVPPGFNGKIGSGQSFFVFMSDDVGTSGNVTFNNTLRNNTFDNSQFYRMTNEAEVNTEIEEKHCIWLNIIAPNNYTSTTLVGYIAGATYGKDRLYDATFKVNTDLGIYSFINDKTVIINGRPAPFDNYDSIPIGITIPANGIYSIGINTVSGLFENPNQNIYIEDLTTGITHNIRLSPYSFSANTGNHPDRFILKYNQTTLATTDFNFENSIAILTNEKISIKSSRDAITQIEVYDVLGKLVNHYTDLNQHKVQLTNLKPSNNVFILRITLENNVQVNKKIIY